MVRRNIKNKLKANKAFTEKTLEALRSIQLEYSKGFIPLFERLSGVQVAEVDKKTFTSLQGAGNQIFEIIQRLIDSQGKPLARDIEDLFLNLDFVENQILEFKQRLVSEDNTSEDFQKISNDTKKSLDGILKAQKESKKGIRQTRRGFFKGQFESGSALKQVFGGVAAGVLGPFAPLAQIASKDIFRLFKGLRQRRLDKEKIRFGKALAGSGVISEDVTKQFEGLTKGKGARVEDIFKPSGLAKGFGTAEVLKQTGAGILSGVLGPFAPLAQVLGKDVSRLIKGIKGRVGRSEKISEVSLGGITPSGDVLEQAPKDIIKSEKKRKQSALFQFFDKDAFKAKWTKQVLNLLRGGLSKTEKRGQEGFLSGIVSTILGLKAFKLLRGVLRKVTLGFAALVGVRGALGIFKLALLKFGSILAVAGIAIASFKLGNFIFKKFLKVPLDKFFTKREQEKLKKEFEPVTKKEIKEFELKVKAQRLAKSSKSVKFSLFKQREKQRIKERFQTSLGEDNIFPFTEGIQEENILKSNIPTPKKETSSVLKRSSSEEIREALLNISLELKKGLKEVADKFTSGTTSTIALGKSNSADLRRLDDDVLNMFNSSQVVLS